MNDWVYGHIDYYRNDPFQPLAGNTSSRGGSGELKHKPSIGESTVNDNVEVSVNLSSLKIAISAKAAANKAAYDAGSKDFKALKEGLTNAFASHPYFANKPELVAQNVKFVMDRNSLVELAPPVTYGGTLAKLGLIASETIMLPLDSSVLEIASGGDQ